MIFERHPEITDEEMEAVVGGLGDLMTMEAALETLRLLMTQLTTTLGEAAAAIAASLGS